MPTLKELRKMAATHKIAGRSTMNHLQLTAELQRAGHDIPDPVLPQPVNVRIEWRQQWRLVPNPTVEWAGAKMVKQAVDGDWELIASVDERDAPGLVKVLAGVWPHGELRIV